MAKIIENRAILQFYTAWKGVFSQSLLARAELKLQESLKEQRLSAISRSQSADIEAANRELKTVNEEREKEMMSLKGKLEEMMRNEEFLKREVREMQGKWKECREELANTQRNSEEERKKLDKMVKNYEIQLQTAKSQVDSLHQDLLQKSDTLQKTYENARHLEKDLETRLQQLEEENTVLKRELKSRETGLQHTELLSLSLKAGLDKAARLLTPAVSQTARVHIRSQSGLEEKPGVMKTTEQLVLSKYRAYRDTDKPRSRRYVTQTEDETSP